MHHKRWLRAELDTQLELPWPRPFADRVRALPPRAVLATALAGTVAVGALDMLVARLSGHDFVLTVLYLLPVGLTAWALGRGAGLACASAAAAVEGASAALVDPDASGHPGRITVALLLELLVFVAAAQVLAALRDHLERERELSRTDPVTGIPNRRAFREAAALELERARRHDDAPLSLAFLDVDDFKRVNDTRGHAAGDLLLRAIAVTLQSSVRATDLVARLGGDEFAILLPDADEAACRRVFDRLRTRLHAEAAQHGFDVTFSVGVTSFATAPPTLGDLVEAADHVMYAVKRGAKDGIRFETILAPAGAAPLREPA